MSYDSLDILQHSGVAHDENPPGRGSGRYGWGTGKYAFQRPKDFLERVYKYRNLGMSDKKIAEEFKLESVTVLKAYIKLEENYKKQAMIQEARKLRSEGKNPYEIGRQLNTAETTIRGWLDETKNQKLSLAETTADYLQEVVDAKGMIDVTPGGTEHLLGNISSEKLTQALVLMSDRGYPVYARRVQNATNPKVSTITNVLCPPGSEYKDVYTHPVGSILDYDKILTDDGTKIRPAFAYPESMDSSRIAIRYGDEGGTAQDGFIEVRPGVPDLNLGNSHYAQVRILVDGTHYIKGMAGYSDKVPEGKDIVFNTNKPSGTPMLGPKDNSVLKPIVSKDEDPDNPFGSTIKPTDRGGQNYWKDEDGNEHLGLINKTREESEWSDWTDAVPSQFLAKQPQALIKKQLKLTLQDKKDEYDEIMLLTNPTVKKKLLMDFASQCDKNAESLKASPFPSQKYKVIIPLTTIKDNEVYAPTYENGEKLALIRYPHAGRFEIPIVTVNNRNREGSKRITKEAEDGIGINAKVAERLSGADFDGDTVMVIPQSKVAIASSPPLRGLENFSPSEYQDPPGTFKPMKKDQQQKHMGMTSNLITDMTLKGAKPEEITMAVKHSMVVIDAVKHGYNWQRSEKENHIQELKDKWMGHDDPTNKSGYSTGASTIISAAKSPIQVPKRKGQPWINQKGKPWYDPSLEEGALIYKLDPVQTKVNWKTGKEEKLTTESTKMAEARDAMELVSEYRTPAELLYADFANQLKRMANQARKDSVYTESLKYNPSARLIYSKEVDALKDRLINAELNKPREREAQRRTNEIKEARKRAMQDQGMSWKEIKKELDDISQRTLTQERAKVGAARAPFDISEREWEAIQAGAISDSMLSKILLYANPDRVRELSMPRTSTVLSPGKEARLRNMYTSGLTNAQIANALGVSASTVSRYIREEIKGVTSNG